MAFLVEKEAAAVVHPHFHQADQYQVVVQGSGRLGSTTSPASRSTTPTPTPPTARSSRRMRASPGSPCATPGIPGARYMPEQRRQLREARASYQHREATCGPLPPLTDAGTRRPDRRVRQRGDRRNARTAWAPGAIPSHQTAPSLVPTHPPAAASSGWCRPASRRSPAARCCPSSPAIFVAPEDPAPELFAGPRRRRPDLHAVPQAGEALSLAHLGPINQPSTGCSPGRRRRCRWKSRPPGCSRCRPSSCPSRSG